MAGLVTATAVAAPHVYPHIELAPWLYPVVGVDLDLNVFRGTQAEFDAFARGGQPALTPP
jgi:hypothetical protein